MVNIINAAPQANLLGIKDESRRVPLIEPEVVPTHLPHVFGFARKGPLDPQLVIGDSLVRMYGAETLDLRGIYATHQTVLIDTVNSQGNSVMFQRVLPEDAPPPASVAWFLDVLVDQITQYERNVDNSLRLDGSGNPIPIVVGNTPVTKTGLSFKWVLKTLPQVNSDGEVITQQMIEEYEAGDTEINIVPVSNVFNSLTPSEGDRINGAGDSSTLYPWIEAEVSHAGEYGNHIGHRLWAATARTQVPVDEGVVNDNLSALYRIQFLERDDAKSTPYVIESNFGEQYVDFSFKEGALNRKVDKDLFADLVIVPSYEDMDSLVAPPKFGPFSRFHIYHQYVQEVSALAHAAEALENPDLSTAEGAEYLINLMSGQDVFGNPYFTLRVLGPSEGGELMSEFATHYAAGGGDGTMTFETFDDLVGHQCENYGDLDAKVLDSAKYPQSVIYDSGFSLVTKKKLLVPIGRRKDMWVVLSTQDVSQRQNTTSEESSMAIALRAAANVYPESEFYGTSTCRAIVIGHSGYLLNSQYKKLLPLTIEFAGKCADFMGAGNGIWNSGFGFDEAPTNQVSRFRDVNSTYKSASVKSNDWTNGLCWVQFFDRRTLFWPAFQTVYDDDTSVLNSAANMMICVEIEKICERSWRQLTGNSKLTVEQFIERSNLLITNMSTNRFDDRVVVVPETYITDADDARGYSYSCKVHLYLNNMKTVGTFTVVAHRRSDLEAAA